MFLFSVAGYFLAPRCPAQDPWEFMPLHGGSILGEAGEDDATTMLAEGFPGQHSEPGKDRWIEPIDGSGGLDNVAPRLGAEEGPGGLEWDPSPGYTTRYPDGTNYAGNSQGNNWFMKIPYAAYDATNNDWIVRFDAYTLRWYDVDPADSTVYWGRAANARSKIKVTTGSKIELFDISGKIYAFTASAGYLCTEIKGLGGRKITISYPAGSITIVQNNGTSDVRKFTYTITNHGSGNRIDRIDVAEWTGSTWDIYRSSSRTTSRSPERWGARPGTSSASMTRGTSRRAARATPASGG